MVLSSQLVTSPLPRCRSISPPKGDGVRRPVFLLDLSILHHTDEECESAISKTVGLHALLEQGMVHADAPLRAMVEMLAGLRGSLDLQAVMDRVPEALLQTFDQADEAFVGLGDSPDKPEVAAVRFRNEATNRRVHVSRTVVERAVRSKSAILSKDVNQDSRFNAAESIHDWQIPSLMCAPILNTDAECTGFLQLNTLRA